MLNCSPVSPKLSGTCMFVIILVELNQLQQITSATTMILIEDLKVPSLFSKLFVIQLGKHYAVIPKPNWCFLPANIFVVFTWF